MFSHTPPSTLSTSATEYRYASASQLDGECARWGSIDRWLSDTELSLMQRWRNPHRRQDWLRGRMLAKQLIAYNLGITYDLMDIAIVREGQSQRPCVVMGGQRQFWSLSISHSSIGALAAISRESDIAVGVDLTDRTLLSPHMTDLWFTKAETVWLREQPKPFAANTQWALKEAIYKACNRGEGFDPRKIEVVDRGATYYGEPITFESHCETFDDQIALVVSVDNFHHPLNHLH